MLSLRKPKSPQYLYLCRVIYSPLIYILKGGYISHYIGIAHVSSPRLRVLLWITGVLSVVAISNVLGTPCSAYPSRVDAGRNGAVQPVRGRADADRLLVRQRDTGRHK